MARFNFRAVNATLPPTNKRYNLMKLIKLGLRIYIAISTVFGFLVGWILLAHSGKPTANNVAAEGAQAITSYKLDPLPPVPSLNDLVSGAPLKPLPAPQTFNVQPSSGFSPRFRSGGSR